MIHLLLLAAMPTADAFCGTFVGGVGSEFFNEYSQIAVIRSQNQTSLTIVNDIQGEFDSFALVIPVPEVIEQDSVHVLEPELFDRLDAYSAPRLVSYECEDFAFNDDESSGGFDSGVVYEEEESGVEVEAEYIVGEYQIVVLSATQSEGLFQWLTDHYYQLPGQSIPLLQEYIDGGSYFLAAKVAPDAGIESGDRLSPLQLNYNSSVFQIPIRIGTLQAKDAQDLVIYALNDYDLGRVGISNYEEFTIEDECMWETQGEEFGQFYASNFSDGYDATGKGAWTLEYAWGGGNCDPCSGEPPNEVDLVSLGLEQDVVHYGQYFFTRLHMRYTPAQVEEELMLYHTNITNQEQIRYIEYKSELEDRFPVCGIGMVENPNTCDSTTDPENPNTPDSSSDSTNETVKSDSCGGCDAAGGSMLGLWVLGSAVAFRRRKS